MRKIYQYRKSGQIEEESKVGKVNPKILTPRYNIAPSQVIEVVLESGGERIITELKWGLVPHWSKDDSFAFKSFLLCKKAIKLRTKIVIVN